MLSTRPRRILAAIALIFILYAIYTSPASSADAVHGIWDFILTVISRIFAFFDQLITG